MKERGYNINHRSIMSREPLTTDPFDPECSLQAEKDSNCDDLRSVIRGLLQEETRFVQELALDLSFDAFPLTNSRIRSELQHISGLLSTSHDKDLHVEGHGCERACERLRTYLKEETKKFQDLRVSCISDIRKSSNNSGNSVSSISPHDLQVGTDCLLLDFLTSAWTFSNHCFHLDELWGYAVFPIDFDGASSSIELFLDNARAAMKESADVHPVEAEIGRGGAEIKQVDDDCVSVSQAASAISEEEMDGDQSFSTGESLPKRSVAFGSDTGAATYESTELLCQPKPVSAPQKSYQLQNLPEDVVEPGADIDHQMQQQQMLPLMEKLQETTSELKVELNVSDALPYSGVSSSDLARAAKAPGFEAVKRDGEVSETEPKEETRLSKDLVPNDVVDEAQPIKNSGTSRIDQGSTFESVLVDGFLRVQEDSGRQSASGSEAVQDSILHPLPEKQYEDAESQLDVELLNEPPKLDSERRATFGSRILPAKRSLIEKISRATCDCSAEGATGGQPAFVRVRESVNDQVGLPLEPPVPVEVSSKTKLCFSKGGTPYWLVSFTIQSNGDHWIELQGLCYTRNGDEKPVTIVWPSGDIVLKGEHSFVSYAVRFERTSNVPPQMIFQWQYRKLEKKKIAKREGPVKNPRTGSEYIRLPPTQVSSARKSPEITTPQPRPFANL